VALLTTKTRHALDKRAITAMPLSEQLDRQSGGPKAAPQLKPSVFHRSEGDLQDSIGQFELAPKLRLRAFVRLIPGSLKESKNNQLSTEV